MKHIVSVVVDSIPSYDGILSEEKLYTLLSKPDFGILQFSNIEHEGLYYSKEEFITEFMNKVKEFYLTEKKMDSFFGCVEGTWFDCSIQENNNQATWDDEEGLEYRDLYSIKVNAYKSFQDYNDGWEMEDGQGGMVDLYSKEDIEEYTKDGTLEQTYVSQAELAYAMIFP